MSSTAGCLGIARLKKQAAETAAESQDADAAEDANPNIVLHQSRASYTVNPSMCLPFSVVHQSLAPVLVWFAV